jgi:DAK2 domain fusion protein YloV
VAESQLEVASEPSQLTAEGLSRAFAYATDWLGVYVEEINALNVYPVPDGDTGTNMHLTMQSVRRQLHDERARTMAEVAHALSYGSLLGARGNSGVILSQILKGFAETLKRHDEIGSKEMIAALKNATKTAYAAVMKPVEGTILTVLREASEAAARTGSKLPLGVLRDAHESGQESLARTPDLLPMLKQAGVVDAGGLGLLRIIEGVIAAYEQRDLPPKPEITKRAQTQFEAEEFGYCTEFLLSGVTASTREIQQLVAPYGDSLLVVGAEGFVKGHIHTHEPEKLLTEVARYGRMVRSKVEDMSEQHSEILADADFSEALAPATALVTVSDGEGITKVFRSLGARVVGGRQSSNPSVQDIADVVRSVGADDVIVMPNNKNIVMAAERVAEIVTDKRVHVLPTRTMGQGLAAAVMFNEATDVDELMSDMQDAADSSVTLEVTTASRTATAQ